MGVQQCLTAGEQGVHITVEANQAPIAYGNLRVDLARGRQQRQDTARHALPPWACMLMVANLAVLALTAHWQRAACCPAQRLPCKQRGLTSGGSTRMMVA